MIHEQDRDRLPRVLQTFVQKLSTAKVSSDNFARLGFTIQLPHSVYFKTQEVFQNINNVLLNSKPRHAIGDNRYHFRYNLLPGRSKETLIIYDSISF